jgi:hypothetical protein
VQAHVSREQYFEKAFGVLEKIRLQRTEYPGNVYRAGCHNWIVLAPLRELEGIRCCSPVVLGGPRKVDHRRLAPRRRYAGPGHPGVLSTGDRPATRGRSGPSGLGRERAGGPRGPAQG